ncbi:MAG TPA: hypothetical protein PKH54_13310 [Myxococcota bacterium]|nr:hypothetical protein [Myxococcota bacterium]
MKKLATILAIAAALTMLACGGGSQGTDETTPGDVPGDDAATDEGSSDAINDASPEDLPPVVPDSFQVGYAELDITPPVGTILGGYGVPAMNRVTEGTHDPLMAQAALFTNNAGQALLLISADLAGYMWDFGDWGPGIKVLRQSIVDALAPTMAITPEQIVIASSHSHGAPDLMGFSQEIDEGPDKELLATTITQFTSLAQAAAAALKPATVLYGKTNLEGISARDKDCSPVLDTEVGIIQAQDGQDKVIVTIANFAKHPTIAPESNRLATADFIWGYREEMKKATDAPAMYFQGFEAAVHGRYSFYDEEDFWDKVYEIGKNLADAVLAVSGSLTPAGDFGIQSREATYSCVGRESFMVDAYTYMGLPKRFIDVQQDGTLLVREIPVSWHRLGNAEFVAFPGEPSPEYGVMAKERMSSSFKFALGLANDATGYMVEPQSLANDTTGQLEGYELKMGLGPDAGPSAWDALQGLGWFDGGWQQEP